nr:solute carrier family 2, facilitated glucose transporter member 5-like [Anolis sagrei ordinatus]
MEKRVVLPTTSKEARKADLTKKLIWITVVSCLLSMHYGYNFWVSYSPTVLVAKFYNISVGQSASEGLDVLTLSVIIGAFPLGGIFGAIVGTCLTDRIGRKGTLLLANFLALLSALFMASSHYIGAFEYVMFARTYTGMCAGMVSTGVPLYLGEIAPRSLRGSVVMVPHLFLTIGVLLAQALAHSRLLEASSGWPILMGLAGIFPLCQSVILPFLPESPRYLLIQKKNEEKAIEALQVLRGRDDVEDEIQELHQEDVAEKADKHMNALKLIRIRNMRWHVLTIVVLMTGQQFSGTNAVRKAELSKTGRTRRYQSWNYVKAPGCYRHLCIYLVDNLGRRVVLLIGYLSCSITLPLLLMSFELQKNFPQMTYISAILIGVFLLSHAFGPYPIPYLIVTELFLQSSRSSGFMIAGILEWLFNFITGMSFIEVEERIGNLSIMLFFPVCILCFVYIFNILPETKNRTFVDIKRLMAIQTAKKVKIKQIMSA